MLRYIRCNNKWIDTLAEQRDAGITYIVIDGMVIAIDAVGNEDYIGKLEGESDEIQSLC